MTAAMHGSGSLTAWGRAEPDDGHDVWVEPGPAGWTELPDLSAVDPAPRLDLPAPPDHGESQASMWVEPIWFDAWAEALPMAWAERRGVAAYDSLVAAGPDRGPTDWSEG